MYKVSIVFLLAVSALFGGEATREFEVGDGAVLNLTNISGDITVRQGDNNLITITSTQKDDRIEVTMEQSGNTITVKTNYPKGNNYRNGGVDFEVTFPADGDLNLQSVSGSVQVTSIAGDHNLKSVSGNVVARDLAGELSLNSVSGDVDMSEMGIANIDANSVSGDVKYQGGFQGDSYAFNSTSGDVVLTYESSSAFNLRGQSVSGSIDSDSDSLVVHTQKYSGMKSVSGDINGGGAEVSVNTVSGRIRVQGQ